MPRTRARDKYMPGCVQKTKPVKCTNCYYLEKCNSLLALEERRKQKEREDELKACKCFKCVWGNNENMYCPFPRCMQDELKR